MVGMVAAMFTLLVASFAITPTPTPSWPAELLKYESRINNTHVDELMLYAETKVQVQLLAIQANVAALQRRVGSSELVLDLLWPGASFTSVACGGQFEVLSLLQKQGLLRVGNLMGASGGSTSMLFALSDSNQSSRTLLRSYDVSAQFVKEHPFSPGSALLEQPAFWKTQYEYLLQSDQAFERLKQQGHVSLTAGKIRPVALKNQYVLYNFTSKQQCADSIFASGEASVKGGAEGDTVEGLTVKIGTAEDGGSLTAFLSTSSAAEARSRNPAVYFHTFYDDKFLVDVTPATIDYLFKRGVDDTLKMLLSPDFILKPDAKKQGGMVIAMNGTYHEFATFGYKFARKATFLDILSGVETKVHYPN